MRMRSATSRFRDIRSFARWGRAGTVPSGSRSPGDVEIALKIINLQGQGLKEFRAIGIVKRLRHPNLIPIYAFWLKDKYGNFLDSSAQDSVNLRGKSSELIIAMGLGDKSLAQRLEECKSAFAKKHGLPDTEASLIARLQELGGVDLAGLPIEELLEYMFGSARAIDYLNQPTHSLGTGPPSAIQHCDIKPGNLLIVSNDVQVCDYGLARVTGDARKTQAAGTPAYMAPELIAGKPSSGTDQYSFAITFYELRTGRLPFDESLAFHAHITGQMDFGLVTPTEQKILKQATHTRPDHAIRIRWRWCEPCARRHADPLAHAAIHADHRAGPAVDVFVRRVPFWFEPPRRLGHAHRHHQADCPR